MEQALLDAAPAGAQVNLVAAVLELLDAPPPVAVGWRALIPYPFPGSQPEPPPYPTKPGHCDPLHE